MNRMCQTLVAASFIAGLATASVNPQMRSGTVSDDHVAWICFGACPVHRIKTIGLNDDAAQEISDVICCLNDDMVRRSDEFDDEMKPFVYLKQTI